MKSLLKQLSEAKPYRANPGYYNQADYSILSEYFQAPVKSLQLLFGLMDEGDIQTLLSGVRKYLANGEFVGDRFQSDLDKPRTYQVYALVVPYIDKALGRIGIKYDKLTDLEAVATAHPSGMTLEMSRQKQEATWWMPSNSCGIHLYWKWPDLKVKMEVYVSDSAKPAEFWELLNKIDEAFGIVPKPILSGNNITI